LLAVNNVSVKVDPGDFVAVVGESGSGKSTSARTMLDLIRPDSGTVALDGVDVSLKFVAGAEQTRTSAREAVIHLAAVLPSLPLICLYSPVKIEDLSSAINPFSTMIVHRIGEAAARGSNAASFR
jgi:ABC-type cobalamin/Fe3+-siderophores transport system ATPase subunit